MRFARTAWLAGLSIIAAVPALARLNPRRQDRIITWSSPSTGPSGTFNGQHSVTVVTSGFNGAAIPPSLIANSTPGSFTVTASTLGAGFQVISASFTLTNLGPPASAIHCRESPSPTAPRAPEPPAHRIFSDRRPTGSNGDVFPPDFLANSTWNIFCDRLHPWIKLPGHILLILLNQHRPTGYHDCSSRHDSAISGSGRKR